MLKAVEIHAKLTLSWKRGFDSGFVVPKKSQILYRV